MKVLALDVGDQWTGSALSDPLGLFARPYQTVKTTDLKKFLEQTISKENIRTIIVGHPKTLRGTSSQQTKKVETFTKKLESLFPSVTWKLWDERLTSKMAAKTKKKKTKEDKLQSHSIAAAFILDSYLSYLQISKNMEG